ncbi:MAG: recombination protein RecR [Methylococcales bacterium]|nr:recombination protein RecR [Methylococcales bacterium]
MRCLPGVGPKSAQRMALHLLQRDRAGAKRLGTALLDAMERVTHCERCRIFTEIQPCRWCTDPERIDAEVCVVESPADVLAIDRSTSYRGRFFLLLGHLSPLDGVGPKELGLDLLEQRLDSGDIKELTLATNPTVEGQATARYIAELAAKRQVTTLQIARGVPMGSELEFADGGTLSVAFSERTTIR